LPRYPEQREKPTDKERASLNKAKDYLEQAVIAFQHTRGAWNYSDDAVRARAKLEEVKVRLGEDPNLSRFAPPRE
jgi:hypothetical protein